MMIPAKRIANTAQTIRIVEESMVSLLFLDDSEFGSTRTKL